MKRLVILSPNWLGDAVMALPAIADLRRGAPDASIAIAARSAIAPLFSLVPEVDETIVLPGPGLLRDVTGWRGLGSELAGRGFDTALLLPNSMQSALRVSRAGMEHFPLVLPMDAVTSGEKQHGANRPPSAVQFCLFQELKRRGTTDWSI